MSKAMRRIVYDVATWETVCEIAAALPGTALDPADRDNPAWRVNGKVLVRRNPRLRVPDEDHIRGEHGEPVAIRTNRSEREALMQQDSDTFFITPHWESSPSVLVWLETVSTEQLRELVTEAWRTLAPKRVARELDQP